MSANKAQFNTKDAKNFRAIMAKWADAHGAINECILRKQDAVKALNMMIATNDDLVKKLDAVKDAQKIAQKIAETADFKARVDALNKELAEFKKAQSDRIDPALALVTDDIYTAYAAFMADAENGDLYTAYALTVVRFFEANGVVSGDATVSALCAKTGADRASARHEYKTGNATKAMSKAKFKDIFIRSLCDIMRAANCLPEYKYQYVPVSQRKDK